MADLHVEGLEIRYGGMRAVSDVSFSVGSGEIIGIAGPNGAGKTSLLRAVGGIVQPSKGQISFGQDVIARPGPAARPRPRAVVRRGVSLVPEGRRLFSGLSVLDHLKFGAYVVGSQRIKEDLELVFGIFPKLLERSSQNVATLSGGEKQMVAIARALMARPDLLMIDELALGLAPVVVKELMAALIGLNRQRGLTIIVVDEGLAPLGSAVSRILFLAHGEIKAVRTPLEIKDEATSLYLSGKD